MAFRITRIRTESFPDEAVVATALTAFGLSKEAVINTMQGWVCKATIESGRGYQQDLASELQDYLESALSAAGLSASFNRKYSLNLNERADIAFSSQASYGRLFVEIEFRPNVEKDLVKFQIGHNSGRLATAVLILPFTVSQSTQATRPCPNSGSLSTWSASSSLDIRCWSAE